MKKIYYCIILLLFSIVGCKVDNYEAPNLTLTGRIVDSQTNALVESGGANGGAVVKFYQDNSTQPLIFNTLPDGTFTNSKMFGGSYTYVAEGPFKLVSTDPQSIVIDKNAEIEIKVVPNVRVNAEILEVGTTTAKVKLTFDKLALDQQLVQVALIWSTYPNPNNFTFAGGAIKQEDVSALNLTSGERIITLDNLKPNTHYYVRGSSRTVNPGSYYNYSVTLDLQTK